MRIALVERRVRICFESTEPLPVFESCLRRTEQDCNSEPHLEYVVRRRGAGFTIAHQGSEALRADDAPELLLEFERDLSIRLQSLRPDLLFLHAAALATHSGVCLLVGESGAGKSTLSWALASRGLEYLSDEVAPICPKSWCVHPYPRAISLKTRPDPPFEVPKETLSVPGGFRIPLGELRRVAAPSPVRLDAIFFLEPDADRSAPPIRRSLSRAEAATRLLASALNPRAHPEDGLDAALEIAKSAPSFELHRAALGATCALVEEVQARQRVRSPSPG